MMPIETSITCPFDKTHNILKHKMQTHLYKCKRNYPGQKVTCVFDSSHLLDPEEWQHHFMTCPSSGCIKRHEMNFEQPQQVGTVPLEEVCSIAPVVESADTDDWNGSYPSYDPVAQSENKSVFRVQVGLSKAKKREYKYQERERLDALEKNEIGECRVSTSEEAESDPYQPIRGLKNVPEIDDKDFINNLLLKPVNRSAQESQELPKSKQVGNEGFKKQLIQKLRNIAIKDDSDEKENNSNNSTMTSTAHEDCLKIEIPDGSEVSLMTPCTGTGDVSISEEACNLTWASSQSGRSYAPKHSKKPGPRKPLPRLPQNFSGEIGKFTIGRGCVLRSAKLQNQGLNTKEDDEKQKELYSLRDYDEKDVDTDTDE
ncbi:uncharacterized protein LOC108624428 [Ceratina calcarata]|uniref:Uncharacterized protein LOC108624428 n=1 Tax=Ceratina calcarata TaxID=156304 RepID=A0AAJ7IXS1_9HYME|nr:uncharacterized protein LOC108624428 [Ceratina calcarata]